MAMFPPTAGSALCANLTVSIRNTYAVGGGLSISWFAAAGGVVQRSKAYYSGKTLLITGATGFLGKAIVEALIDRLPEVRRVYLLVRPRSDEAGAIRILEQTLHEEIIASLVFDRLRTRLGSDFDGLVHSRLTVVAGDLAEPDLGMDEITRRKLQDETDVIIHGAAITVFDAPFDQALRINTLGPQHVLDLARSSARRPLVAHVSTCYVNNEAGPCFEMPLDPRWSPQTAMSGEHFDVDDEVRAISARLVELQANGMHSVSRRLVTEGLAWARRRGWNDTYTFTKAMGEQLLCRHRGDVPMLILRPSIIESSLRDPAPGWIEGLRMIDPLVVGFARGQISDFPGNPESVVDLVPADIVVNALLAAIPKAHVGREVQVLHVATGMDNPLRLVDFHDNLVSAFRRDSLAGRRNGAILRRFSFPTTSLFLRRLDRRHVLPVRLMQAMLAPFRFTRWAERRLTRLRASRRRLERLRYYAEMYGPYAETQARFLTYNLDELWRGLDPVDRRMFPFSVEQIDWRRYFQVTHIPGIKRYLLRRANVVPEPTLRSDARVPISVEAATVRGNGSQWRKAAGFVALTRTPHGKDLKARRTPVYRTLLRQVCLRLIGIISRRYLHLQANGVESLPARGPFIVVSNHCSHIDTGLLLTALGGHSETVHPLAAADYWYRCPVGAWLMNSLIGAIPIDRRTRNVWKALGLPAAVLRRGHSLIFYPEGTRSADGKLRRFRSSVGLLALASGVPVVPAHVAGTHHVLPKGRRLMRRYPVQVRFGPAIRVEPYLRRLQYEEITRVARRMTGDLQAAVEALAAAESCS